MPSPEFRDRWQAAVLWLASNPAQVDDYGVIQVGAPTEIRVQWKNKRGEQQQPDGSTVTLDAQVKVWQEVPIGSHLWLGTLAQWYGQGSSGDDDEVRVVLSNERTPDPKARWSGYSLGVMRWKNKT